MWAAPTERPRAATVPDGWADVTAGREGADEAHSEARSPGPLPPGQSRGAILDEVGRRLADLPPDSGAVVALSGGPDSTALAYLTAEARPDLDLHLVHVRHGLREDAEDLAVVRCHASWLALPLHVEEVEVEAAGEGLEAAAREARYRALRRRAAAVGARWVLVGHTADDQAETVLLRLARGTGVPGLGAMSPVRGDLVRPLLRLRRRDVRGFVAGEGLPVVRDPMNQDPDVRRVRVRREVLPALERLGPDPVGALARLAALARDDARTLADQAAAVTARLVRRSGPVVAVSRDDLEVLPTALASRVVRQMVREVRGTGRPPSAAHTAAILDLAPGSAVDLPGARATAGGGWLAVGPAGLTAPTPRVLRVPGTVHWPSLDLVLEAAVGARTAGPVQLRLPFGGRWSADRVEPSLLPPGTDAALGRVIVGPPTTGRSRSRLGVRPRRPGDRVVTRVGTRKLKDVMIDAGVPRLLRPLLPVVCAGKRILWVPGLVVDAEAAARAGEEPWATLTVSPRDPGADPRGVAEAPPEGAAGAPGPRSDH